MSTITLDRATLERISSMCQDPMTTERLDALLVADEHAHDIRAAQARLDRAAGADFKLSINADSGYQSTMEGRCTASQYAAAVGALHNDQPERDPLTTAAKDVIAERFRQQYVKGWVKAHDDEHVNDEIAAMAAYYAMPPACRDWPAIETGFGNTFGDAIRPEGWFGKTGERRRELVKSGALIIAEIERIDRAVMIDGDTP